MAADIESLIRQALARQNGFDPAVRAKIYQSSRNALAKMIANSGVIPPNVIDARNRSLEETINKIESEFTAEVAPAPRVNQTNVAAHSGYQNQTPDQTYNHDHDQAPEQTYDQTYVAAQPAQVSIPQSFEPRTPATEDRRPPLANHTRSQTTGFKQTADLPRDNFAPSPPPATPYRNPNQTVPDQAVPDQSLAGPAPPSFAPQAPNFIPQAPPPVQHQPSIGPQPQGFSPGQPGAIPVEPADNRLHINMPMGVDSDHQGPGEQYATPTPQYARPRRKPIRYFIWIIFVVLLLVVGWIAYTLTISFLDTPANDPANGQVSQTGDNRNLEDFITILEPTQPGALITAGNGTAEILSDVSQPAIRIMSVRKPNARKKQAKPLLLEIAPGILKDIAGKKVTVEILAKSGDSGPATFVVICQFGQLGECGRKRFRVGLQPEAVIFSIQIAATVKKGQRAYLAINTDVTSAAPLSGKGSKIDIIYAGISTKKR